MAENIKGTVEEVGRMIAKMAPADIQHMPVIASCGMRVGIVDRVEGNSIKLTRSAPAAHGEHRYIPLEWVASIDMCVHLNKTHEETERDWTAAPPIGAGV